MSELMLLNPLEQAVQTVVMLLYGFGAIFACVGVGLGLAAGTMARRRPSGGAAAVTLLVGTGLVIGALLYTAMGVTLLSEDEPAWSVAFWFTFAIALFGVAAFDFTVAATARAER